MKIKPFWGSELPAKSAWMEQCPNNNNKVEKDFDLLARVRIFWEFYEDIFRNFCELLGNCLGFFVNFWGIF